MEIHDDPTPRRVQGQDDMHVLRCSKLSRTKPADTFNFLCRHSQSHCVRAKSQPPHSPTLTYPTIDCSSTAPAVDTSTLWPSWRWRGVALRKTGPGSGGLGRVSHPIYQEENFSWLGNLLRTCSMKDWSKVKYRYRHG